LTGRGSLPSALHIPRGSVSAGGDGGAGFGGPQGCVSGVCFVFTLELFRLFYVSFCFAVLAFFCLFIL